MLWDWEVDTYLAVCHIHDWLKQPQQHSLHVHHVAITGYRPMVHLHTTSLHVSPDYLGKEIQQPFSAFRGGSDDRVVRGEELILQGDQCRSERLLIRLDIVWAPGLSVEEEGLVD